MVSDKNKKGLKVDKSERAQRKEEQVSHSPSLSTYSPPPAYSWKDPLLSLSTPGSAAAVPITAVARSSVQWTRRFECGTDESVITLTSDGSYVHYSRGIGKAPSAPTNGGVMRKYFNADGSSLLLSREGWIEYDDGAGTKRTMSAGDLRWHYYANREGWFAYAISQPSTAQTMSTATQSPRSSRHDSRHGAGDRRKKASNRDRHSDSESEDDGYDDMYKYAVC